MLRAVCRNFFNRRSRFALIIALITGLCIFQAASQTAPAPTTATLSVTPASPMTSGTVVTLTASVFVTEGGGQGTGQFGSVIFCNADAKYCEDVAILGTAQLTSKGTATLKFVPGIGVHHVKAVFQQTTLYASSTSDTQTFTVTGTGSLPTTSAISSTTAGSFFGTYTLTGTLTAIGTVSPTGSFSFVDATSSNSQLATAQLGAPTVAYGFTPASGSPFTAGNGPRFVAVGDFNGDGVPDLAIANYNDNTVTVLLGDGKGGFTPDPGSPFGVGFGPESVAIGDFNSDGVPDLVVANINDGTVSVLLGNARGGFGKAPGSPFSVGSAPAGVLGPAPISVATGDFNGDGVLDVVTANALANTVSVLLGDGKGGFSPAPHSPFKVGTEPESVAVGDFNGDGVLDLVTANTQDDNVTLLLGDGKGGFSPASRSPFSVGKAPLFVAVGDFDGNGVPDLAVVNFSDNTVSVLVGDGKGGFSAAPGSPFPVGVEPDSVAIGDFNNDGVPDLAVSNVVFSNVSMLLGDGKGVFSPASDSPFPVGPYPQSVAVADFNGDGVADITTANYGLHAGAAADATTASPIGNVTVILGQVTQTASATAHNVEVVGTGNHDVFASYPGDENYAGSKSSTISLAAEMPTVHVSPPSLDFGNQLVGTSSAPMTVTINNAGTGILIIESITVTPTPPFKIVSQCSGSGSNCSVVVAFAPTVSGAVSGNLTILSNDHANPQVKVPLTGTGIAPKISVSPTSINFGNQLIGTTSAAMNVTVSNIGTANLAISAIALAGPFR